MSTFSKPSEPTLPRNCRRHYEELSGAPDALDDFHTGHHSAKRGTAPAVVLAFGRGRVVRASTSTNAVEERVRVDRRDVQAAARDGRLAPHLVAEVLCTTAVRIDARFAAMACWWGMSLHAVDAKAPRTRQKTCDQRIFPFFASKA